MNKKDDHLRAIEVTFPLVELNRIAERESTGFGRRHYRPVYVMHKWWARRLGSVFRSILILGLADSVAPDGFWEMYSSDLDFKERVVLDPMMGGGTTIVEALRLGCVAVGGDINPVAWFVVKKEIEEIDPEELRGALRGLERDLGPELRRYYVTVCPVCGNPAEGIYYFYRKEMRCPDCGKTVPLMRDFFLAKSPTGRGDVVVCPQCWHVFETDSADRPSLCPACNRTFTAKNVSYVRRQILVCPNSTCSPCRLASHVREQGSLREVMYAIEFYCKTCDHEQRIELRNGRGYKAPDEQDTHMLEVASEELLDKEAELPIPDTPIPAGVETRRALNYGYVRFRDLFGARQLLNLGKIYRWILQTEDENLREFLILAFSNCLKYNNMFCKYNGTRGFITDIFRTHSYSPSMTPVEANCYDISKGRGAFTAFVQLVIEGKEYCRRPFERVFHGERPSKLWQTSPIAGRLAGSFGELGGGKNALLQCGPSERLNMPDRSADLVVTDPPYAGNVMYSELSNFFYVWLRLALKEKYAFFEPSLVPWEEEIISNAVQGKGQREFLEGLTRVFTESNRVLKDDGLLILTFHHRDSDAWASLLQSLLSSGYTVQTVYPVRSEMIASTHLHGLNNIKYDSIIVCRKREPRRVLCPSGSMEWLIRKESMEMIRSLRQQGETPQRSDEMAIVFGKCLEIYSKYSLGTVNEAGEVDVRTFLSSIKDSASLWLAEDQP